MSKYYSDRALDFGALEGGEALCPLEKQPSNVGVMLYCASIRNFHRLHFDADFAREQGFDGLIVPGFMIGNWCAEAATRSFAADLRVARLRFRNAKVAYIGMSYRVIGSVAQVDRRAEGAPRAKCSIEVLTPEQEVVTHAEVTVVARAARSVPT